jgi:hypothetical protein
MPVAGDGDVSGIVTKVRPRSVDDGVSRLSEMVVAKAMTLFTVIDDSGQAEAPGLGYRWS